MPAKPKLLVPVADAQALAEIAEDDDMMGDVLKVRFMMFSHVIMCDLRRAQGTPPLLSGGSTS